MPKARCFYYLYSPKEGELKSLVYGETTEILLCLAMQEEHLDENLPLSAHIMRRIAVDAYEQAKMKKKINLQIILLLLITRKI